MTLDPILAAPLSVQLHVAAAVTALLLGPVALWRRRRDGWHRAAGYAWVTAMAALAITGLAIPSEGFGLASLIRLGPFGPIHLLSIVTLWSLFSGVRHARAGRVAEHRATMRWMYFGALALAGLFTLLPGRRLNAVLFGDAPAQGWVAILVGAGLVAVLWLGPSLRAKLPLPFNRTTR